MMMYPYVYFNRLLTTKLGINIVSLEALLPVYFLINAINSIYRMAIQSSEKRDTSTI